MNLNIPGGHGVEIPVFASKVPKPEEVVFLSPPLLSAVCKIGDALQDSNSKWALWGDAGEIIKGVNLRTDHLEILTTKEGCVEICAMLGEHVSLDPAEAEKKLEREADVDGKMYSVRIRSLYAELAVDGVKVEVYGSEQIKVGDWDWGDPLDFEPDHSYIIGKKIPIVPLRFRQELDLGLGWLDRLELITKAIMSGQHHIATGGVK